jgi:hypothetical protein
VSDIAVLPEIRSRRRLPPVRAPTASEIAWLAVVPCTVVVVVAILLLGPPLGGLLFRTESPAFWEWIGHPPHPEPTENARYVLSLAGPLALTAAIVLGARGWQGGERPLLFRLSVGRRTSEALVVAFVVACVVVQHTMTYGADYGGPLRRVYFTAATLGAAVLLAVLLAAAVHSRGLGARAAAWVRERSSLRLACAGLALLVTATWLLTAIVWNRSAGGSNSAVSASMPFWLDETYAVLDGRTPLVNFTAQYSYLWPYVAALAMSAFGTTLGGFTTTMAIASGAVLLSVYGIMRRVVRNSVGAVALYLPFLATGFFMELGPLTNRYGPSNLLSEFPMRYGGPYLLAWLVARHVDGARPRRSLLLFAVAGLVALNNTEFGVAALGATLAALLWTRPDRSRRAVGRLLGACIAGVAGALAIVSVLTLLRAHALPQLGMLLTFAHIYGVVGWALLPMPTLGFHLVIYVTFVAAIVVATVRAVGRQDDVLLTAMLVWTGVFGLGAGSYFAGHSHPEVLIDLFSIWAFTIMLLLVAAVRSIRARPSRLPTIAEFAVLVGVGIAVCSIAQTPTPWSQVARIREHSTATPFWVRTAFERFVRRLTVPGEHVVILLTPSHKLAYDVGVVNVAPYVGNDSIPLERQLEQTLDIAEREHALKLFLASVPSDGYEAILRQHGFEPAAHGDDMEELIDRTPGVRRKPPPG